MPRLFRALSAGIGLALALPGAPAVLAQAFNLEEQVQLCAGCHGENGVPQENTTPIIWGQHVGYAYLQLKDFKSTDRKHETMNIVAENLSRSDMLELAEAFAKKPWPRVDVPSAGDDLALRAGRINAAVGCTGCHQDGYKGEGTQARLAGQSREYLLKTMLDIRSGVRGNNAGMTSLMKSIGEEDLAVMAEYLAGLRPAQ